MWALAGVRNGEPLAALGATALQDLPAVLRRHPHEETVRFLTAPSIRLKCTFALRHDLETSVAKLVGRRNTNSNEPAVE